jgi:hypothetical protein
LNAYDIMHEWDRATGKEPRSDEELDEAVPALLPGTDYQSWKGRLEARDLGAIKLGMKCWGLPIGHLGQFEMDDVIGTFERDGLGPGQPDA